MAIQFIITFTAKRFVVDMDPGTSGRMMVTAAQAPNDENKDREPSLSFLVSCTPRRFDKLAGVGLRGRAALSSVWSCSYHLRVRLFPAGDDSAGYHEDESASVGL
jgi:hypothetical protein